MLTMSRSKRSKPGWKLRNGEIIREQKTLRNMLLWKRLTKTEKRRKELMATLIRSWIKSLPKKEEGFLHGCHFI
jgi:hypothetical protein